MKTAVIFTSNRSEWGLLKPLAIRMQDKFNLKVIACASHLNPIYYTIKDIEEDFSYEQIECAMNSDTPNGSCKSSGILMITLPDLLERINPKFVIILGDRYESISAALVCYTMGIKIVHLHAGEKSGNIDNVFRDCISRMAYLHCAATEKSKERLIEEYNKVFFTGALGCENLKKVGYKSGKNRRQIIVSYHPNTLDKKEDVQQLISGVDQFLRCKTKSKNHYSVRYILANNDFGGMIINNKIKEYIELTNYDVSYVEHLKRDRFIELLKSSFVIIGNSSCGIIEAPLLGIPTINIGSRQKNREKASSIVNIMCDIDIINYTLQNIDSGRYIIKFNYIPYKNNSNSSQSILNAIIKVFGE